MVDAEVDWTLASAFLDRRLWNPSRRYRKCPLSHRLYRQISAYNFRPSGLRIKRLSSQLSSEMAERRPYEMQDLPVLIDKARGPLARYYRTDFGHLNMRR